VVTASTPEEAAEAIATHGVDLVVTDRVPVDGPHDASRWLAAYPSLRVLGTSESVSRALARVATSRRVGVVARPLAADQVAEAVRALLEAPAGMPVDPPRLDAPTNVALFKPDPDQPIHPLEAS
jgi:DNA-binding NarL/FixJ family response regulator